jgi:hypothetical protein
LFFKDIIKVDFVIELKGIFITLLLKHDLKISRPVKENRENLSAIRNTPVLISVALIIFLLSYDASAKAHGFSRADDSEPYNNLLINFSF